MTELSNTFPLNMVIDIHDVHNRRLHIGDVVNVGPYSVQGVIGINEENSVGIYYADLFDKQCASKFEPLSQQSALIMQIEGKGCHESFHTLSPVDYADIYAVDFDDTLYFNDREFPHVKGGQWNVDLIKRIKLIQNTEPNSRFILWSCRNSKELKFAIDALASKHSLYFDAHNDNLPEVIRSFRGDNCRKVFAHHYIDDRNCVIAGKDKRADARLRTTYKPSCHILSIPIR